MTKLAPLLPTKEVALTQSDLGLPLLGLRTLTWLKQGDLCSRRRARSRRCKTALPLIACVINRCRRLSLEWDLVTLLILQWPTEVPLLKPPLMVCALRRVPLKVVRAPPTRVLTRRTA